MCTKFKIIVHIFEIERFLARAKSKYYIHSIRPRTWHARVEQEKEGRKPRGKMRFNFRIKQHSIRWIPVIRVNMYLGERWNAVNIGIALSTRPRIGGGRGIINPLGSTAGGLSIRARQAKKNRSIIEAIVTAAFWEI